jgi:hypothetical protein
MILYSCLTKNHRYKKELSFAFKAATLSSGFHTNATWLNKNKKNSTVLSHNQSVSKDSKSVNTSRTTSNTKKRVTQTYNNYLLDVHVIANGFMNSPKACMITTSSASILINCGEGTGRIIHETSLLNTKNTDHVFFTRFDWSVIGGLQSICRINNQSICRTNNIHENPNPTEQKTFQIHSPFDFSRNKRLKNFLMTNDIGIKQHSYKTNDEFDGEWFVVKRINMDNETMEKSQKPVWSYLFKFRKVKNNFNL